MMTFQRLWRTTLPSKEPIGTVRALLFGSEGNLECTKKVMISFYQSSLDGVTSLPKPIQWDVGKDHRATQWNYEGND